MNPVAPVSMLTGSGSAKAILVVAVLVGLVLYARSQPTPQPAKKQ